MARLPGNRSASQLYDEALARLQAAGHVYACACTRRELEVAPVGVSGERVYPGTCRDGLAAVAARTQPALLVACASVTRCVECHDRLQTAQRQDLARDVGDFVVKRADGLFAYQLAVVVDDAEQRITDVVRGADLLASTPRQVLLQGLLGFPTPSYLHVPVAINAAGEKLSKQTRAAPLPDAPVPALARRVALPRTSCRLPDAPASAAEFWGWATRIVARRAAAAGADAACRRLAVRRRNLAPEAGHAGRV